jgi:NADH-quinone oxidoreductase subunit M
MLSVPISYVTILLPLLGTLFVARVDKNNVNNVKSVSLWITFFTLMFAILQLLIPNLSKIVTYNVITNFIDKLPVKYSTNVDDYSILFASCVSSICFLSTMWLQKREIRNTKSFFISLLLFEAFTIGAFYSSDMFLLFFCMEATLIPIYSMILSWDNTKSNYVLLYLAYSMFSAMLILVAIIMIYLETKSSNLLEIYKIGVKNEAIFWLLMIGTCIKLPIWPLCNWLPTTHTKTNVVCSVLLSSIILKFSTLILIRFINPIFSEYIAQYQDVFLIISIISIFIAVISIMFQDDIKRFFAYFSIIHMDIYFIIFLFLSETNKNYFIFSTLQHGFISTIIFFTADIMENLFKTRSISTISSSGQRFRGLNILLFFVFISLIDMPCTPGFITEIVSFYFITKSTYIAVSIIMLLIIVALSAYTLFVYYSISFKKRIPPPEVSQNVSLCDRYQVISLVIAFLCIEIFGILPDLFF